MTKAITLAVEGENGPEVALPNTSADLTGYANADAPGVENVADALDDMYARSPGNITALTARVDGLENGQTAQDADISAANAAAADWTASKPGIVRRVEALEKRLTRSATAPEDTGSLWLNTSNDTLNYHDGTAWKTIVGRYADA